MSAVLHFSCFVVSFLGMALLAYFLRTLWGEALALALIELILTVGAAGCMLASLWLIIRGDIIDTA